MGGHHQPKLEIVQSLSPSLDAINPCQIDKALLKAELSAELTTNFLTRAKVPVTLEGEKFKLTPQAGIHGKFSVYRGAAH